MGSSVGEAAWPAVLGGAAWLPRSLGAVSPRPAQADLARPERPVVPVARRSDRGLVAAESGEVAGLDSRRATGQSNRRRALAGRSAAAGWSGGGTGRVSPAARHPGVGEALAFCGPAPCRQAADRDGAGILRSHRWCLRRTLSSGDDWDGRRSDAGGCHRRDSGRLPGPRAYDRAAGGGRSRRGPPGWRRLHLAVVSGELWLRGGGGDGVWPARDSLPGPRSRP